MNNLKKLNIEENKKINGGSEPSSNKHMCPNCGIKLEEDKNVDLPIPGREYLVCKKCGCSYVFSSLLGLVKNIKANEALAPKSFFKYLLYFYFCIINIKMNY